MLFVLYFIIYMYMYLYYIYIYIYYMCVCIYVCIREPVCMYLNVFIVLNIGISNHILITIVDKYVLYLLTFYF